MMKLAFTLWVGLNVVALEASAAETGSAHASEADHVVNVKCASVAVAAAASARSPSSGSDKDEDDKLVSVSRNRANESGQALGLPLDQVNRSIDDGAAKILRNLSKTGDKAELKQEQLDLGRVLIECAILQTKK